MDCGDQQHSGFGCHSLPCGVCRIQACSPWLLWVLAVGSRSVWHSSQHDLSWIHSHSAFTECDHRKWISTWAARWLDFVCPSCFPFFSDFWFAAHLLSVNNTAHGYPPDEVAEQVLCFSHILFDCCRISWFCLLLPNLMLRLFYPRHAVNQRWFMHRLPLLHRFGWMHCVLDCCVGSLSVVLESVKD